MNSLRLIAALLDSHTSGKVAFVAVYVVLLVWLVLLPAKRIGMKPGTPFWKNVRYWAIAVATTQILVYAIWG